MLETLMILGALGVLAWLLAGGWPCARDAYVADDGPVGLGAGVTALCPACAVEDAPGADRQGAPPVAIGRTATAGSVTEVEVRWSDVGLRPAAVGRDQSLRLECPRCGMTYSVLAAARGVPSPRPAAD